MGEAVAIDATAPGCALQAKPSLAARSYVAGLILSCPASVMSFARAKKLGLHLEGHPMPCSLASRTVLRLTEGMAFDPEHFMFDGSKANDQQEGT